MLSSVKGCVQGLAEGADVLFEVELLSFDKQPHMSQLSAAQSIQCAQVLKNQGNVVFKKVGAHAPATTANMARRVNRSSKS